MSQIHVIFYIQGFHTHCSSLRPLVGLAIFIFGMQASTTVVFTYPVDCCKSHSACPQAATRLDHCSTPSSQADAHNNVVPRPRPGRRRPSPYRRPQERCLLRDPLLHQPDGGLDRRAGHLRRYGHDQPGAVLRVCRLPRLLWGAPAWLVGPAGLEQVHGQAASCCGRCGGWRALLIGPGGGGWRGLCSGAVECLACLLRCG